MYDAVGVDVILQILRVQNGIVEYFFIDDTLSGSMNIRQCVDDYDFRVGQRVFDFFLFYNPVNFIGEQVFGQFERIGPVDFEVDVLFLA